MKDSPHLISYRTFIRVQQAESAPRRLKFVLRPKAPHFPSTSPSPDRLFVSLPVISIFPARHTVPLSALQYYWLREDLCTINRKKTPWVIAFMHVPLYSTNREHYVEVRVAATAHSVSRAWVMMAFIHTHVTCFPSRVPTASITCPATARLH